MKRRRNWRKRWVSCVRLWWINSFLQQTMIVCNLPCSKCSIRLYIYIIVISAICTNFQKSYAIVKDLRIFLRHKSLYYTFLIVKLLKARCLHHCLFILLILIPCFFVSLIVNYWNMKWRLLPKTHLKLLSWSPLPWISRFHVIHMWFCVSLKDLLSTNERKY